MDQTMKVIQTADNSRAGARGPAKAGKMLARKASLAAQVSLGANPPRKPSTRARGGRVGDRWLSLVEQKNTVGLTLLGASRAVLAKKVLLVLQPIGGG